MTARVYLAGPLGFSEAGRDFHHQAVIPLFKKLSYEILDPWSQTQPGEIEAITAITVEAQRKAAWIKFNQRIAAKNQELIDRADLLFAVLDGQDVDSGTAAEIGYAFARQKRILGYRGDFRLAADNEGALVNLQVEYFIRASGGTIVHSLKESETWLVQNPTN